MTKSTFQFFTIRSQNTLLIIHILLIVFFLILVYFHQNAQLGLYSRQQECNMPAIFCFHCTCCSKHSWTRCSQTFILLLSFVLCCWFVLSGLSLALFSQKQRLCSCDTNLNYVWFIMQMDRRINCVKNKTIKCRQQREKMFVVMLQINSKFKR